GCSCSLEHPNPTMILPEVIRALQAQTNEGTSSVLKKELARDRALHREGYARKHRILYETSRVHDGAGCEARVRSPSAGATATRVERRGRPGWRESAHVGWAQTRAGRVESHPDGGRRSRQRGRPSARCRLALSQRDREGEWGLANPGR